MFALRTEKIAVHLIAGVILAYSLFSSGSVSLAEPSSGSDGASQVETGVIYLHNRYYDSQLSRFISPDPTVPTAANAGLNRYAYTYNGPASNSDVSGLGNAPLHDADGTYDKEPYDSQKEVWDKWSERIFQKAVSRPTQPFIGPPAPVKPPSPWAAYASYLQDAIRIDDQKAGGHFMTDRLTSTERAHAEQFLRFYGRNYPNEALEQAKAALDKTVSGSVGIGKGRNFVQDYADRFLGNKAQASTVNPSKDVNPGKAADTPKGGRGPAGGGGKSTQKGQVEIGYVGSAGAAAGGGFILGFVNELLHDFGPGYVAPIVPRQAPTVDSFLGPSPVAAGPAPDVAKVSPSQGVKWSVTTGYNTPSYQCWFGPGCWGW